VVEAKQRAAGHPEVYRLLAPSRRSDLDRLHRPYSAGRAVEAGAEASSGGSSAAKSLARQAIISLRIRGQLP
jgi:hypothetical protein